MLNGRLARAAVAVMLLWSGTAVAQTVHVALTPVAPPLQNAVTQGTASSISFDVTNGTGRALRQVEFQFPASYRTIGGTGPAGWTVTRPGPRRVRFTMSSCTDPGLAQGATQPFQVQVTPPSNGISADVTETMSSLIASDPCTRYSVTISSPVQFQRKALLVIGTVAPSGALTPPLTATVNWKVTNLSTQTKNPVTLQRLVTPASGWGNESCSPSSLNLSANGGSATINCTYSLTSSSAYSFYANASATGASAVGAVISMTVGTAHVDWARPILVQNRRTPYALAFSVVNTSPVTVSQVQVITGTSFTGLSGSGSGLTYSSACSSAGTACWSGTLAAGATAALTLQIGGIPSISATTPYTFQVKVTPATGSAYAVTYLQQVILVVPIPDVSNLTVLSDPAAGQVLTWSNTDGPGSPHDGVVIFRTQGAEPPLPQDFVDYTTPGRPASVIYADGGGSPARSHADPIIGVYYYRVCNHDAYLVYSGCNTGFWNGHGYADSAEAPAGGWTHQLGGELLNFPAVVPGNRVGLATNRPEMAILDLRTGLRSFDPVTLGALPSVNNPATRLVNGTLVLFTADQGGRVKAINLADGTVYWQVATGESFVAGVSGIPRAFAAPAFRAAYPMDVLLLGSATTGNVLAIDATTGQTLWTVNPGTQVRALITYDAASNHFYVPTSGGGVIAYDMGPSTPARAAVPVAGWNNPGGTFTLYCVRVDTSGVACVDSSGLLRVLDKVTGAVQAQLATGLLSPTALVRVIGSSTNASGFVVGSAGQVQRLVSTGTFGSPTLAGAFTPQTGVRLSPVMVFMVDGYIMVAGSDRALHKLSLADAHQLSQSQTLLTASGSMLLGPIAYDTPDHLFVFGTSEGRVWAIPSF